MKNKIVQRILDETGDSDLFTNLAENLSLPDLQSLLLEVYRERTASLSAKHLFDRYKTNRFVQPSPIKPEHYLRFDQLAFSLLPDAYETIELSPVSPLGSCSIVTPLDQNNMLSTIRNTEVCSDPTNMLALQCAKTREKFIRAKEEKWKRIKLCASHRVLRTQPVENEDSVPHFRIFSLCAAGRDEGSYKFEMETLSEQLDYFTTLLFDLNKIDIAIKSVRILLTVFDKGIINKLDRITGKVNSKFSKIKITTKLSEKEQNYYRTVRYHIFATNRNNEEYFLCDGGFTDWTQQLLSNQKERYLISGFGTERLFLVF